jgi:hypothetical protein
MGYQEVGREEKIHRGLPARGLGLVEAAQTRIVPRSNLVSL